jgi:hypothetical protein
VLYQRTRDVRDLRRVVRACTDLFEFGKVQATGEARCILNEPQPGIKPDCDIERLCVLVGRIGALAQIAKQVGQARTAVVNQYSPAPLHLRHMFYLVI